MINEIVNKIDLDKCEKEVALLIVNTILLKYFEHFKIRAIHNVSTHINHLGLIKLLEYSQVLNQKSNLLTYAGVHPMVTSRGYVFSDYYGTANEVEKPYIDVSTYIQINKIYTNLYSYFSEGRLTRDSELRDIYLGEVGLDVNYVNTNLEKQGILLSNQLISVFSYLQENEVADDLMVNLHLVGQQAYDDFFKLFKQHLTLQSNLNFKRLILNFHSFNYPEHLLKKLSTLISELDTLITEKNCTLQILLGIGERSITSAKKLNLLKKAKLLPKVVLVAETDLPFSFKGFLDKFSSEIVEIVNSFVLMISKKDIADLSDIINKLSSCSEVNFDDSYLILLKKIYNTIEISTLTSNELIYPIFKVEEFIDGL
ncbi:hypothetical protein [Psittacicella hinzii]|nr:hypothetical protein [Psittacicella hinzii]